MFEVKIIIKFTLLIFKKQLFSKDKNKILREIQKHSWCKFILDVIRNLKAQNENIRTGMVVT